MLVCVCVCAIHLALRLLVLIWSQDHEGIIWVETSPSCMFQKLCAYQNILGFVGSKADSSLFIKLIANIMIFILLYVDGILIISTHSDLVAQLIVNLNVKFTIKDLGGLFY